MVGIIQSPLSHVQFFVTPWTAACQAPLPSTISWSLLEFMSIESVMLSNHLILYRPLLLPSIFSSIRVFSSESTGHQMAKGLELQLHNSPSNEYSELISCRNEWFDLLAEEGTAEQEFFLTPPFESISGVYHYCPHFQMWTSKFRVR